MNRLLALVLVALVTQPILRGQEGVRLNWEELPAVPDELGFAGPFVGVHPIGREDGSSREEVLIVAGGANFPKPIWESQKVWHNRIFVATKDGDSIRWTEAGKLDQPVAYGAAVSTPQGVICIGGADATEAFSECFCLRWDPLTEQVKKLYVPSLPTPCAFGAATLIGDRVYVSGGQSDLDLSSAMNQLWSLDMKNFHSKDWSWEELPDCPGATRALNLTVSQHNGFETCVYVMSGRRQNGNEFELLSDTWEFAPTKQEWRKRSDAPRCVMAGTGIDYGQSHIFVLGGDDGELFGRADELKDNHPGFIKRALAYHTITDTWVEAGATPTNQVTTIAVKFGGSIVVASGEVRPRVRTPNVYRVTPATSTRGFGIINYIVLFGYLLAMVGVGVFFAKKNKTTDDFFRGGKRIPWWAAGCSIFATMLSSLTFTGIPSKAFAQDCVYAVGNFMIPVVAVVAVFVALPFFRRIDATSAYEYLEKRFSRGVRLFGSASFTLFHLFRMAVVMSLTGLALAVATPLTPTQSVLLMGVLSILYCTMGGVEAVIWTDTIQTVVLLGGALLAIILLILGCEGGVGGFFESASQGGKFNLANFHLDASSARIALWVVVVGAIGQNLSSYTADQAVVQRYMTTETQSLAGRSIWTNAVLTVPATILFFGVGTGLYAFYRSHPEKLDPTITTDQVFPLFIAHEMPVGIAGLIVAGVFAAAQSTVSTSMNSTATAIVTDFLRPRNMFASESGYLTAARTLTFIMGVLGTLLGLVFVNPNIKSLFDTFIAVIGLFMGVLGGLFILGATTKRANGMGAMTGALVGATVMFWMWKSSPINGYLYTTIGISTCVIVGFAASLLTSPPKNDLGGLTIHTLNPKS